MFVLCHDTTTHRRVEKQDKRKCQSINAVFCKQVKTGEKARRGGSDRFLWFFIVIIQFKIVKIIFTLRGTNLINWETKSVVVFFLSSIVIFGKMSGMEAHKVSSKNTYVGKKYAQLVGGAHEGLFFDATVCQHLFKLPDSLWRIRMHRRIRDSNLVC